MLGFFRRALSHHGILSRDNSQPPHPQTASPTETAAYARCSESEYCFFNHAAMLPFDQLDECCCGNDRHERTPSSYDS
ncbi:hypothetical protein [Pectobacterium parmentieri]|uniref:hypothetical protein n=1 Tax=Pectobacterium parmentieri TaxID=1905730 RepID=UPI000CDE1135|nr:hypothetical protein [Pectobacterium parmentieri]AYH06220.1 hypothetical protein C5E25_13125 [Pectobacterium parmentieri]AYH15039.1 hypothetical protein C5E23_13095 [Pectobacterium parmentieri]AYH23738.1 hypothetical protein C5E21_13085 [Pectobacterium parmentieri]MBN3177045.1 hypothetical protein [Pectobacterium parmentieri]POW30750.1 hypothetical protein PB20LOC_00644 [Pectobacterium parmentieri]